MSANQLFLVVLFFFAILSLGLHIASIKWGLSWANIARISLLKAFGLLLVFTFAQALAASAAAVVLFKLNPNFPAVITGLLDIVWQFLTATLVVMLVYKANIGRAAKAAAPYFLVSVVLTAFSLLIVRPIAYEAYVVPTNGMAPTLLGVYWEAPCPRCGAPAYCGPPDPTRPIPPEGMLMVCSKELQSVLVPIKKPAARGDGDRILACKFLTPKRWDLIVFRCPEDPSVNYVKRVVGLPGEKLAIHDAAVWINGERQEPPASIRGIRYSPTIESHGRVNAGPGSNPVDLGSDEYFVIGDFVDASLDSRFWKQGAPGHPPYAVPAADIIGVVVNTYWPATRWASFR